MAIKLKNRPRQQEKAALAASSPPRTWYFDIPTAAFESLPDDNEFTIDFPEDEVEIGDNIVVRPYLPESVGFVRKGVVDDNWRVRFGPMSDGPHRLNFGKYGPPKKDEFRCIKPDGKVEQALTSLELP